MNHTQRLIEFEEYLKKAHKYRLRNQAIVRKYLAHLEGRRGGRTQAELGRQYGMHRQQVHFVLKRAGVLDTK